MKQTKLLLLLAISVFMTACGGDDASDKLSLKEKITGQWVLISDISEYYAEDDAPSKISLDFSGPILTYTKEYEGGELESFRFPYIFTTQNNNINVSYSDVLYLYKSEGWGQYLPDLTEKLPDSQVVNVPGWTFVGSIDNYRVFGYAVKYKEKGVNVVSTAFLESFSQNWKVVEIEKTGKGTSEKTTMILETARLNKNGEIRLARETYQLSPKAATPGIPEFPDFGGLIP
ncbi:hypothetical protein EZS27_000061 [termite gut metagenome]|uniref:Uncharacterized protein n=1 Tax=termite gut metagenome TaxID=433724 RepID=A0A5J4T275_9ZZZZ